MRRVHEYLTLCSGGCICILPAFVPTLALVIPAGIIFAVCIAGWIIKFIGV